MVVPAVIRMGRMRSRQPATMASSSFSPARRWLLMWSTSTMPLLDLAGKTIGAVVGSPM